MAERYISVMLTNEMIVQLPVETDGCVYYSTLESQDANANGLQFLVLPLQTFRGVSLVDGRFLSPIGGWSNRTYFATGKRNKVIDHVAEPEKVESSIGHHTLERSSQEVAHAAEPEKIEPSIGHHTTSASAALSPINPKQPTNHPTTDSEDQSDRMIISDLDDEEESDEDNEEESDEDNEEESDEDDEQNIVKNQYMTDLLTEFRNRERNLLCTARAINAEIQALKNTRNWRRQLKGKYPVLQNDFWYVIFKHATDLAGKYPEPPEN